MINCLPVNSLLVHRGMLMDDSCRFCFARNESILHVLRDCVIARGFGIRLPSLYLGMIFSLLIWLLASIELLWEYA